MQPTRVRSNLKINKGRIIRLERQLERLEKRLERLEKQNVALKAAVPKPASQIGQNKIAQLETQNAGLKAELAKLRAKVDENARASKRNAGNITRLLGLGEPVRALVRSFKQTPGAPFTAWRMWMLSTFKKQGLYRRRMFK